MAKIITIDGPSSSGKSSIGFLFSQKIGFQFIDTGAIYRAGSFVVLNQNINPSDHKKLGEVFENLNIQFKTVNGKVRIFLDDQDVSEALHTPEVTKLVPVVAAVFEVRAAAKKIQYQVAQKQDTIMAGRDIGSEIFPDAPLKFFITASPEVRAKRRFEQHKKNGEDTTFEKILEDTKKRDEMDENREASPMRIPKGAVIIDTSDKTIDQTVTELLSEYKKGNI